MKILIATSALLATVFTTATYADDSLSTKIHNQYTSLRAMGMGNAFTAVADDYSLMFYNPAGFSKKRYNEVQFTLIGAGVSPKTLTLMNDIKTATASGTDSQKASALSAALEPYYGQALGGKVQAAEIFWTRKNWGFAILPADLEIDMSINRQLGPAIDLKVIGDTTIAYGYGTDLNKYWSAGITAKYVHRVSIDQSVAALELASDPNLLSTKRFKEGTNADFDIGFMWTPDWFNTTIATTKIEPVKNEVKVEKTPEFKIDDPKKPEDETRTPQAEVTTTATSSSTANATAPADTPAAPEAADPAVGADTNKASEKPVEKTADVKPEKKNGKAKTETKKEVVAEIAPISTERFPLTFGLVFKNLLGGTFSKSTMVNKDATEAPTAMYRTIDFGSHYELGHFGDLTLRSMLDFKNMLHPDITLNKSVHAGLEFDYYPNSWFKTQFRIGANQTYYTAGFTFLFGILHIDAVTYGEEVGTTSTKLENRVYAAKVGFNF